ncbi:hypothetical protein FBZ84_101205 [Azospirillum baldaniorum]|uniref:hypothetical protein n=1 Tax=Azospirillum baldaniorum TaxID=1064539 RepID=UPI0011AAA63A|nr:hypothetical protein [Azospirillum baldaniorum]TWA71938.1 hypothetical protein FBZ84_101205 [Azospirillum baldaniorum]
MSEDDAIIKAATRAVGRAASQWRDANGFSDVPDEVLARASIRAYLKALEEEGWVVARKVMTEEMTRSHLAVDKPATFRDSLRHPDNGPRLSAEIEAEIKKAEARHAAVLAASPKPPGADL